jgi:Pescadillo N-terminus
MGRLRTKGKAGAAKAYVTRSSAVKRLQCSLADFRRLCILKGKVVAVFPIFYLVNFIVHRHLPSRATQQEKGQQGINCSYIVLLCQGHRIPRT